jgi:hypothetical protein
MTPHWALRASFSARRSGTADRGAERAAAAVAIRSGKTKKIQYLPWLRRLGGAVGFKIAQS